MATVSVRNFLRNIKQTPADGQPVILVDTKKKELVGNYKNNGREWGPEKSLVP